MPKTFNHKTTLVRLQEVLDVVRSWPGVTTMEVADEIGVDVSRARELLKMHPDIRSEFDGFGAAHWHPIVPTSSRKKKAVEVSDA